MVEPAKPLTPDDYIGQIPEPCRAPIKANHAMITGALPDLKPSLQYGMIGYGTYHYKYDSGREGDAPIIALASRKGYISIYDCGPEIQKDIKRDLPKADFGKVASVSRNPKIST